MKNSIVDGVTVTHSRAKQRTDKKETRFLVPSSGNVNYASYVVEYLNIIKSELGVFTGRLFYTGTPTKFVNSFIGKNTVSNVPKEVANLLNKQNCELYTFHSLRRSSATAAADAGASVQQLMDFYGWQNSNMPQEYVSSSKFSVKNMAERLQTKDEASIECKPPLETTTELKKAEKIIIFENFSGTITNFNF